MTPAQTTTLAQIKLLNVSRFNSWFYDSTVMAFVEVESNFDANAYRKEPSGVASYGLMQVLDETAKGYAIHDASEMYDPTTSLRIGMHVLFDDWQFLAQRLQRDPTYPEWIASYNEGPGAVLRGRTDVYYVSKWLDAKKRWQVELNDPIVV